MLIKFSLYIFGSLTHVYWQQIHMHFLHDLGITVFPVLGAEEAW